MQGPQVEGLGSLDLLIHGQPMASFLSFLDSRCGAARKGIPDHIPSSAKTWREEKWVEKRCVSVHMGFYPPHPLLLSGHEAPSQAWSGPDFWTLGLPLPMPLENSMLSPSCPPGKEGCRGALVYFVLVYLSPSGIL